MAGRRSPAHHGSDLNPVITGTAQAPAASAPALDTGGMFGSLRVYPSLRWLTTAILCTNSAHGMHHVTLGWLALQLTDSPFWVGLAGFAGGIPILLLALPAGMVVDRVTRRTVMLGGQLGMFVTSLLFALTVTADVISPWLMLLLALGTGSSMAFIFPAKHAILANLVDREHLANAVAINSAGQNMARIVGPALAGVLIAVIGLGATFAVAATLQLVALTATLRVPVIQAGRNGLARPGIRGLADGLAHVAGHPALAGTLLLATIGTILIMPYLQLMPVFARDELGLGSQGLGIMMAATGFGAVVGALALAGMRELAAARGVQIVAVLAWAASVLAFAQTPWVVPALLLLVATGFLSALFLAVNQTVLQLRVDEEMRGRVMSVILLTWGVMPFGVLLFGALADQIGAPAATSLATLLGAVLSLVVAWRIPELVRSAAAD